MNFNTLRTRNSVAMLAVATSLSAVVLVGCKADTAPEIRTAAATPHPSPNLRTPVAPAPAPAIRVSHAPQLNPIVALQRSLNAALVPLGMPKLNTDGQAGGQTQRALCAERLFTGHVASKSAATAAEMTRISSSEHLSSALPGFIVSRTCQVMGIALDHNLTMIIPISTGAPRGYYSDGQDHTTNPGRYSMGQGIYGLHNSTKYPSQHSAGNMLYAGFFDGDIAVHGSPEMSSEVTSPESHGCVRIEPKYAKKIWELMGGPAQAANDSYVQLRPIPVEVL